MEVISTFLKYKSVKISQIFPIGNEPNGKQWTGFQSIGNAKEGYVLVFREDNGGQIGRKNVVFGGATRKFYACGRKRKGFREAGVGRWIRGV